MSALLFIDTNILLDFYRYPRGSAILSVLEHIDKNHDKIITTTQVEMEYKKNRQKVIVSSLSEMKGAKWDSYKLPVILSEAQAAATIEKNRKDIDKQSKILTKKIESILRSPSTNDDVYKTLQRLFKSSSELNLKRPNPLRFTIRNLARKRFILGYPPRKDSDVTISDAINWEWIIYCAQNNNQDVVIVSRDTDYGCRHSGSMLINDWLSQEFKERVNRRKKVTLTDKLTEGFKLADISVRKKEVEEEDKFLEVINKLRNSKTQDLENERSKNIEQILNSLFRDT